MELKLKVYIDTEFIQHIKNSFSNLYKGRDLTQLTSILLFFKFLTQDPYTEIFLISGQKIDKDDLTKVLDIFANVSLPNTESINLETIKDYPFTYVFSKNRYDSLPKNGILNITQKDFLGKWEKLTNNIKLRITQNIKESELQSWQDLDKYLLIGNTIIIFDPYIIVNDYNTDFYNITNLLETIIKINKIYGSNTKTHIIIIGKAKDKEKRITKDYVKQAISDRLQKDGFTDFEINIIPTTKHKKIHDRGIILNYAFISAGKGFHIFHGNNLIHSNIETTVLSIETNPVIFSKYLSTYLPEVYKLIEKDSNVKNLSIFAPIKELATLS